MIHSLSRRIKRLEAMGTESNPGVTILFTYLDDDGKLHEDVGLEDSPWTRTPRSRTAGDGPDQAPMYSGVCR